MSSPVPNPGLRGQAGTRTALRIAGFVAIVAGLVFVIIGGVDFFGQDMNSEGPGKFWMFFVGLPLFAIGATGETSRSASDHVYCTACGHENSVGDRFCAGCGKPLASA